MKSKKYSFVYNNNFNKGKYKLFTLKNQYKVLAIAPELKEFSENRWTNSILSEKILDNTEEREYIVRKFLSQLIEEIKVQHIEIDNKNTEIVMFWKEYVKDFYYDTKYENTIKDNSFYKTLLLKKNLFLEILKDNNKKFLLLLDNEISPEILGLRCKEATSLLKKLVEEINNTKKSSSIAIINSGQGFLLQYLKDHIINTAEINSFNPIRNKTDTLSKNYKNNITSHKCLDNDILQKELLGKFDHIISVNSLHQDNNIEHIIKTSKLMLKQNGKLHIIDFDQMDPVSVLVAIFFQDKNINCENEFRNGFFYKKNYVKQTIGKYFIKNNILSTQNNKAYYCQSENMSDYSKIVKKIEYDFYDNINEVIILLKSTQLDLDNLPCNYLISHEEVKTEDINKQSSYTTKDNISIVLENIWKENLKVDKLQNESNYFKLGGDSLSATKLIVEIDKSIGCKITLKEIFENSVFNDLLNLIELKKNNDEMIEGEI